MQALDWQQRSIARFLALTVCLSGSGLCTGQPLTAPVQAGDESVPPAMATDFPVNGELSGQLPHPGLPSGPPMQVPFQDRLDRHLRAVEEEADHFQTSPLPAGFTPWWQPDVMRPQRQGMAARPLELDALLVEALQFSPQVQAIRETDFIRSTAIVEAESEFDVRAFMESKFIRTSDPVGDDLTTGGPPRFRDSTWYYLGGARQRTKLGATMELSQRLGYRDNNSLFLDPTQQGNARLSLSFTQPLLNGAGRTYNQSRIILAQLDTRAARDEVTTGLQEHLVEVARAYWDLYLRRAVLRQKQHHYGRGRDILRRLEDRRHVDSLQSQILAAQAAVEVRYADLNRAVMAIRNAESRIRTLVSSPELFARGQQEFIPVTSVANDGVHVSLRDALATALHHRADIDRAIQQTRMAGVRLNMSAKELLPVLNLVLETYVAGLEGRSSVGQAWQNQFSVGEPGYTAGLLFEVPLYNRAARVRHERRQAEMRQVTSELRAIVDTTLLEVEIAVRAVQTAHRDIQANYRSMTATQAEVDYLQDRWTRLPGDDRSASFLLEDLLRAQDRLADAEFSFAEVQIATRWPRCD
ncbi:MAG: TolC family protein [Pirellulaceae bacterium]